MVWTANIIGISVATIAAVIQLVNLSFAAKSALKGLTRVTGLHLLSQMILSIWTACSYSIACSENYDKPAAIYLSRILWMLYSMVYLTMTTTLWATSTTIILALGYQIDILKKGKGNSIYETGWSGWTMLFAESSCEIGFSKTAELDVDVDMFVGLVQSAWNFSFLVLDLWSQYLVMNLLIKSQERLDRHLKSSLRSSIVGLPVSQPSTHAVDSLRSPTSPMESIRNCGVSTQDSSVHNGTDTLNRVEVMPGSRGNVVMATSPARSNQQQSNLSHKTQGISIITNLISQSRSFGSPGSANTPGTPMTPTGGERSQLMQSLRQLGSIISQTPSAKKRLAQQYQIRRRLRLSVFGLLLVLVFLCAGDTVALFYIPCDAWVRSLMIDIGANRGGEQSLIGFLQFVHWGFLLVPPAHILLMSFHLNRLKNMLADE
ncbi:hypothetical protein BDR26DRAFT_868303 [Obelidium mucronatum]|nr:hypothetical protein BDR26DRAFT_868303 [Obelidium mucronatum]